MTDIVNFLTFDGRAEEAARFYVSVFPGARIVATHHYGEGAPAPAGSVMTVEFELFGRPWVALNAGPNFPHGSGVSFAILCETQEEVDRYWARLTDGGQEWPCGWLQDRFGVTWQVTPAALPGLITQPDRAAARRVMEAMMTMMKLDMPRLEAANAGVGAA